MIFVPGVNKRFYGFEFEDGFVNTATAIDSDFANTCENFRTKPYTGKENGKAVQNTSYTGHYISYSAYLWFIYKIFSIDDPSNIHKLGNFLLILFSCLISFSICDPSKVNLLAALWIATLVSMPFVYVANSGLIETLSISIGIIAICCLFDTKKNLLILLLCIFLLTIVKRENLVYAVLPFIGLPWTALKNLKFLAFVCLFIAIQIIINPFYTEGLESQELSRSTFSLDYFCYQAPGYLGSFFNYMGYLLLTILILLSRPSKKSLLIFGAWLCLILTYSLHYRSQYSVESGTISLFETYRYMTNTIPFMWGILLFGTGFKFVSKPVFRIVLGSACLLVLFLSYSRINDFIADEENNYHSINDYISTQEGDITVLDNFSLISKLNYHSIDRIDVLVLDSGSINDIYEGDVYVINRFDIDSLPALLGDNVDNLVPTGIEFLYKLE